MEKMENIVFDRNYEEDKPDPLAQAIFDRVNAPGGFLEEFSKKMDAIPKVIVPKDKENYEYLLERCDEFAKRHHGKIHGVVDFEHWDAHIDLTLPMLEFDDSGRAPKIPADTFAICIDLPSMSLAALPAKSPASRAQASSRSL